MSNLIAKVNPTFFLGSQITNTKLYSAKVDQIIVALNLILGGTLSTGPYNITDATNSTSITTGSLTTAGGLGVTKDTWLGGILNTAGAVTLQSTLAVTGLSTLTGGAIFGKAVTFNSVPVAINSTGLATAAQIGAGVITSTSGAATSITTPTAAQILAQIGATTGSTFELIIDNSAGANTVTLVLDGSITAPAGAITGGNTLTITTTHKVGVFLLYFTSLTTAVIYRIA